METMRTAGLVIALALAANGSALAGDEYPYDDWAAYANRHDKATATSGNAQEVNSITHIITPWPPYVADRRIPGDGARMVGAIRRYHDPRGIGVGAAPPLPGAPPEPAGGAASSGGNQQDASGNGERSER